MVRFLRKLLGGTHQPQLLDYDARAEQLIAILPPCAQYVIVASDRYSSKYRCEVTVPAAFLTPFVERVTKSTFGGSVESKIARIAMPEWLRKASPKDGKACYLPPAFVAIIDVYVLDFIRDGIADTYCTECRKSIGKVESATRNQNVTGSWSEWTSVWRCESGHVLYTEDHEMHILRRREA